MEPVELLLEVSAASMLVDDDVGSGPVGVVAVVVEEELDSVSPATSSPHPNTNEPTSTKPSSRLTGRACPAAHGQFNRARVPHGLSLLE